MGEASMGELGRTVGAPVPESFGQLSVEQAAHLAAAIETAIENRTNAISDAIVASMNHIPALLRPAVKKALGL
jgi:hypothetical protein